MVDNNGQLPPGTISSDPLLPTAISSTGVTAAFCNALVTQFIAGLPSDPATNNGADVTDCDLVAGWDTGYTIFQGLNNRVTVSAPDANNGPINATR
ncbi:MAG: hypothetical protein Q7T50_03595 [Candidatus Magasanikbacteria bacterium]|nr:hypothetical protein [Candidatus Magasanikbacteria bacterium]